MSPRNLVIAAVSGLLLACTFVWLTLPVADVPSTAAPPEICVFGMVGSQGTQSWHEGMTIREVIQARGTVNFANTKNLYITNAWHPTPRYRRVLRKVGDWIAPAEDFLWEAWDVLRLPGNAPDFTWMRGIPDARVCNLDLDGAGAGTPLLPGDVLIVPEMTLGF